MKYIIIAAAYILTFLAIFLASAVDALWFKDPKKRHKVVEDFKEDEPFETVLKKFFWLNLREGILFLGGFTAGLLIMALIP